MVLLSENIQHKLIANLHQSLDRPVFSHGHGDAWWGEAGLADPARHHRATAQAFAFALTGRAHLKPTAETAQRFVEIAIQALHGSDRFGSR